MYSKSKERNKTITFASYLLAFYTMKVEAICHSEMSVNSSTTQCNSKEDGTIYFQCHCLEMYAKLL
jgi:hypothetical protein